MDPVAREEAIELMAGRGWGRDWCEAALRRCNDNVDTALAFIDGNSPARMQTFAERDADPNQNWNHFEECESRLQTAFDDFELEELTSAVSEIEDVVLVERIRLITNIGMK